MASTKYSADFTAGVRANVMLCGLLKLCADRIQDQPDVPALLRRETSVIIHQARGALTDFIQGADGLDPTHAEALFQQGHRYMQGDCFFHALDTSRAQAMQWLLQSVSSQSWVSKQLYGERQRKDVINILLRVAGYSALEVAKYFGRENIVECVRNHAVYRHRSGPWPQDLQMPEMLLQIKTIRQNIQA